jgi:hypothetical protein
VSLALPLAHALVARKDLPIPVWLFAWGASIVLIVSFFALSAAWRKPKFSVIFGDVFRPFNPWRAVGRAIGGAFSAIAGQRPAHFKYPERMGRWPAAIGLLAVVWLEVVYGSSGGVAVGLSPDSLGLAALLYSLYALSMMALFGVEKWCQAGEIFSVYFGMFSQLGSFGVKDGRLGRRLPLSAATHWATVPGSAAVVIASIASTSFDGAQEGAFKSGIKQTFEWLAEAGFSLVTSLRLTDTIFMALCFAGIGLVYLIGVRGMATVRGAPPLKKLRAGFAHTLIPIAFAYLVAHYFSLFVFQEQAQFTYLLSDPLGTATTDLFGTASSGIDFKLLSANAIWYVQVGALVIGHVVGLTLAHDRATAYWGDYRQAARSQYWMLAVMVAFTCFGLYLLSVSNA